MGLAAITGLSLHAAMGRLWLGSQGRLGRSPTDLKRFFDNPAAAPLAVLALVVAGAIIRVIVAGQDLFADELATYWVVSAHDFGGVLSTVRTTAEITPPLSFLLSWLAIQIDLTPELLRAPGLIGGIATIPLVYAVGVRTVGRGAALLAATLTALSPFMIFYSAEARGYGLMMALVLLSTLSVLLAIDRGQKRWWVAYAFFALACAYTHYTSVFVLAAQLLWVLHKHPGARRAATLATAAAAVAYVPWLTSLKADLDSPTTQILGFLSPFTPGSIKLSLGHWALGYPYANSTPLRDLPGTPALLLLAASVALGVAGLLSVRGRIGAWFAGTDRRILLLLTLALATPLALMVASLVGTNIFGTRNLAASWPYAALAGAALITVGSMRLRVAAAALAAVAFALGAARMLSEDYERPNFDQVAEFAGEETGGVVVDAAAFTPGPLSNFEVSDPGVPVLRLKIPEEMSRPFAFLDRPPDPESVARRAARAADGGPITVVTSPTRNPIAGARTDAAALAAEKFVAALPASYEPAESRIFNGFILLESQVYRRGGAPASGPSD